MTLAPDGVNTGELCLALDKYLGQSENRQADEGFEIDHAVYSYRQAITDFRKMIEAAEKDER